MHVNCKMEFIMRKTKPLAQSHLTYTYKFNGATQFNCEESKALLVYSINSFIYTLWVKLLSSFLQNSVQ